MEDVSSFINANLGGYVVQNTEILPREISEFTEEYRQLKPDWDKGKNPPEGETLTPVYPDDYNIFTCTKMKFYGPNPPGYLPSISDDLSGQFFPSQSIQPYYGRMEISCVSSDSAETNWYGSQMCSLHSADVVVEYQPIPGGISCYPGMRGTYWYQDQGPRDTMQGSTGYIFQLNEMNRKYGKSVQQTNIPVAEQVNYRITTVQDPDDPDEKMRTYVLSTEPASQVYILSCTEYLDSQNNVTRAYETSVDNRFGVKWAYRFGNYS